MERTREWPAMRYGPSGEQQIFKSPDDVPEGWADRPGGEPKKAEKPKVGSKPKPKSKAKPAAKKDEPAPNEGAAARLDMSRDELEEAAKDLGVEFDDKTSDDDLAAAVEKELDEDDDGADDN